MVYGSVLAIHSYGCKKQAVRRQPKESDHLLKLGSKRKIICYKKSVLLFCSDCVAGK